MRIDGTDKAESWEAIYQKGDAGWDLAKPAPPLETLVSQSPAWLKPGKLICFGAGKGHDATLFAQADFDVTAVDFAPTAVEAIREYSLENKNLKAYEGDILKLPSSFHDRFDYVLEHTCFCAIPVSNRKSYVEAAYEVLKPGGILFGLFYRFDPPDKKGPPHFTSEEEIRELFQAKFKVLTVSTPNNSHGKRKNRDRLIVMEALK